MTRLAGIAAAPGIAIGPAWRHVSHLPKGTPWPSPALSPDELRRVRRARGPGARGAGERLRAGRSRRGGRDLRRPGAHGDGPDADRGLHAAARPRVRRRPPRSAMPPMPPRGRSRRWTTTCWPRGPPMSATSARGSPGWSPATGSSCRPSPRSRSRTTCRRRSPPRSARACSSASRSRKGRGPRTRRSSRAASASPR